VTTAPAPANEDVSAAGAPVEEQAARVTALTQEQLDSIGSANKNGGKAQTQHLWTRQGVETTVSRVANAASKGLKAIESAKSGGVSGILGAAAGVLGSAADAVGKGAQKVADGLKSWAGRIGDAAQGTRAVEGAVKANQLVGKAQKALEAAKATGDAAQVAAAEKALDAARKNRTNGVLDAVTTGLSLAGNHVGNGTTKGVLGSMEQGTKTAKSIVNKDVAGAIENGFGTAARVDRAVEGKDAKAAKTLDELGKDGGRIARGTTALVKTKGAVSAAEQALAEAKKSGDADAIREARAAVRAADQALRGAILDVTGAAIDSVKNQTGGRAQQIVSAVGAANGTASSINNKDVGASLQGGLQTASEVVRAGARSDEASKTRAAEVAKKLEDVGVSSAEITRATQGVIAANQAVSIAEKALEAARKTGNTAVVRAAERAVAQADQRLRGAILVATDAGIDAASRLGNDGVRRPAAVLDKANDTARAINERDA
jgi:hypothetical protein